MEKAILIRRLEDLSDTARDYDCVYFGTEFCQWLIPAFSDFKMIFEFCKTNKKKLVIVTPWVTDAGLDAVHKLVSSCVEVEDALEVVANDLGVIKLLADEFGGKVSITAGRLLSNQRRDPRTLSFKDILNDDLYEHYQHSSFDYQPLIDLLKSFNVNRVEIDNLFQGISIPPDLKGMSFSLYHPYNYVTVTRNCAFCYDSDPSKGKDPWQNKKNCLKKCIDTTLKMNCDEVKDTFYLKGTALFIKNEKVDVKDSKLIDRLVYSPYVPV
jgi:hypothetical protein